MIAFVSLGLVALYNVSFWQKLAGLVDWPFIASVAVLLYGILYLLLTVVSFRVALKPIIAFLFLVGALSAYAMDNYGYVISTQAFQNIVETDSHEVYDLLSWKLAVYLIFLFVIPSVLVIRHKYKYPSFKRRSVMVGICLLVLVGNVVAFNKNYASILRNQKSVRLYINPLRPIYSMAKYTVLHFKDNRAVEFAILDHAPQKVPSDAKPKLVVLVVGEADRAVNHSLNGYQRNTNPYLSQRVDLYNFTDVSSCGTETSVSVPCMFSAFKREDFSYKKGRYTENVLDILQKSDVRVLWRDNDSGCKNVCDRVEVDDFNYAKITPFCNSFECHDEVLLHNLQQRIDEASGDQLIVLHKKGNHGPAYYKRYPERFKIFMPICESNELHDCTNEQIVNTYDNIILYTDFFLDKLIDLLQENNSSYQTAMIYISDHGQSLGEKGVYLHGMPYWIAPKEQTHIPFFVWLDKDFRIDTQKLTEMQNQQVSHDNLFHSLLALYQVKTPILDEKYSVFLQSDRHGH